MIWKLSWAMLSRLIKWSTLYGSPSREGVETSKKKLCHICNIRTIIFKTENLTLFLRHKKITAIFYTQGCCCLTGVFSEKKMVRCCLIRWPSKICASVISAKWRLSPNFWPGVLFRYKKVCELTWKFWERNDDDFFRNCYEGTLFQIFLF